MSWTRVLEVEAAANKRIQAFDVEQDLKQDKTLKQIRKGAVRDLGAMVFDPDDYSEMREQLTIANYKLEENKLLEYAKRASAIRHKISASVGQPRENEPKLHQKASISNGTDSIFTESHFCVNRNPVHPYRKRKSLRLLDADARLKIVKLASSKTR